ncbi:hypothetical protein BEWA_007730 [Theileria equi strain WA]|uniref:RING-type domain-containing protein n=1 Tax=Theileria equi strain WA TaxID=1537102 RepID=L0B2M6_THEEQ|nr:hypothetical protein BEWA_007730 [Theileria equi strain WA]AFZ81364.1 hypothetical protein BEWA_007730 [Theileria equi strain WA]|eukprot:XP_004831030.1 hypothetical protein BEWA_007730 [Theileria equi strain WA]
MKSYNHIAESNFRSPLRISGDAQDIRDGDSVLEGNRPSFATTSIEIPEINASLFDEAYDSDQNLFSDGVFVITDEPTDCEIIQMVDDGTSYLEGINDLNSLESNFIDIFDDSNGSPVNPISVEDAYNQLSESQNSENEVQITSQRNVSSNHGGYNQPNNNQSTEEDEDCIMGPINWVSEKKLQFPSDYYSLNNSEPATSYKFIDNEDNSGEIVKILEDVEFLFKCPICYSTITRFRSGKLPNDNDRVIYSTKCGHLFCYECIENVKKRRECSICRKKLKDSSHCHVVFP